jgi:membrane-bound lytic murein transglycosylase D
MAFQLLLYFSVIHSLSIVAALLVGASPVLAGEASHAPRWEMVLDEVLVRAEAERASPPHDVSSAPQRSPLPANPEVAGRSVHPLVEGFVRYFRGTGEKHYRASTRRLETYRPMMEQVLDQQGLPRELLWVGLVESGYVPTARSPKNAVGIWQFIPETAEAFGLQVGIRDERTDPLKSTHAAARYLKFLYARFGDWLLALAAYNAGEQRIQNAISKAQTTDFWKLAESGYLPRETQAYVPAILAAQLLGGSPSGELTGRHDAIGRTGHKVVFAAVGVTP